MILVPLLLSGVLAFSGVMKLIDAGNGVEAVTGLGVPAKVARPVATVLPYVELALAALLVVLADRALLIVTVLATLLFLAFTVAVLVQLARGQRPPCHCFGALSAEPIGWSTGVRNVLLTGLAVAAVFTSAGFDGVIASLFDLNEISLAIVVVAVVVVAALTALWSTVQRLRGEIGTLRTNLIEVRGLAMSGSGDGVAIPSVLIHDVEGRDVHLEEASSRRAQLLVFVSPNCVACHELVPLFPPTREQLGGEVDLKLISLSSAAAALEEFGDQAEHIWIDEQGKAKDALGIIGTPGAVLLGVNGMIAAGPAHGAPEIAALIQTVAQAIGVNMMAGAAQSQNQVPEPPAVGTPVPALPVVDDAGNQSNLVDALEALAPGDEQTLMVWRHDCSYCEQIKDQIVEESAAGRVVLLINEPLQTIRDQGITGPAFSVPAGGAYSEVGLPGTPAAIPVRGGKVSGTGAIGGDSVLNLIERVSAGSELPLLR